MNNKEDFENVELMGLLNYQHEDSGLDIHSPYAYIAFAINIFFNLG